jgi:hypothetical protein
MKVVLVQLLEEESFFKFLILGFGLSRFPKQRTIAEDKRKNQTNRRLLTTYDSSIEPLEKITI